MPEPVQKTIYKSQLGEKGAYVHLHPDITIYGAYNA